MNVGYRADIDGLRAVAVLPVVLFHAGFAGLPGGFIGVDVFFVISGYLITKILLDEMARGEYSIVGFYERRARRILPALFAVLAACLAAGPLTMLAGQYEELAGSTLFAALFTSNFYFRSQTGYFAPATDFMPLLHTWSLAVEEQFYILFPITLFAMQRFRSWIGIAIVLAAVASFALGLYLSYAKPAVAYYMLPTRAWELLVGATLAVGMLPAVGSRFLNEAIAAAGAVLLLAGFVLIDQRVAYPGFAALAPVLGTACLIFSGATGTMVASILSFKPIVFIGLISYSLYLWHWPVLVYFRLVNADVKLSFGLAAQAVAISFVLAYSSWRFVERPFRNRTIVSRKAVASFVVAGTGALAAAAGVILFSEGFSGRHDEATKVLFRATKDIDPLLEACREPLIKAGGRESECRFGASGQQPSYVILGDSHAAMFREAIETVYASTGRAGTLWWSGGCAPLLDIA